MNWGACYYDHYTSFFHEPFERKVFRQDDQSPSIQILAFDKVIDNCKVFCSLGLTHYRERVKTIGELFMPIDGGWDDIPYIFANALFYLVQKPLTLTRGSSISGIEVIAPEFASRVIKKLHFILQILMMCQTRSIKSFAMANLVE
jgi:antitoxin YqcF